VIFGEADSGVFRVSSGTIGSVAVVPGGLPQPTDACPGLRTVAGQRCGADIGVGAVSNRRVGVTMLEGGSRKSL